MGLGRQAQANGQVPDVPSIARAVFGVPVTTLQQEHLVTSWLGGSRGVKDATDDAMSVDEAISDTDESTSTVPTEDPARVARVLAAYEQRPDTPLAELVRLAYPGVAEPSVDQVMYTAGFLEAAGAPTTGGVAPVEMIVAVAEMRSKTDSGEDGWLLDDIVDEVLGAERNVDGESSRLLGWFEATEYLDALDGTESVYSTFVQRVVQDARSMRKADGSVDTLQVARLQFAVRQPSPTQRAAVRYWLELHGIRKHMEKDVGGPAVDVMAQLLDGLRVEAPQPDAQVSVQQRAEYVVHRAVTSAANGRYPTLGELFTEAYPTGQSLEAKAMVRGFLEGVGLGSLVRSGAPTSDDHHMAGVFAAARKSLEEGERVDPRALTQVLLGRAVDESDGYRLGKVTGWLVVAGLMGGPLTKGGVIERIKGALTGAASGTTTRDHGTSREQREQAAAELYSRVFQEPEPSVPQRAAAVEWLAENPQRVYTRGLARRAAREGRSIDPRSIAQRVYETLKPADEDVRQVTDWLVEEGLVPAGTLPHMNDPYAVFDTDDYVGDTMPPEPDGTEALGEIVDYIVARAVHERLTGRDSKPSHIARFFSRDPHRSGRAFVIGVLEWFGGLGSTETFADVPTFERMSGAVTQARETLAAGTTVKRPVLARVAFSTGIRPPTRDEIDRVKGWIAAAGLHPGGVPRTVREMKDRALALARHVKDNGGEPHAPSIARKVFRMDTATPHQVSLITTWLDDGADPTGPTPEAGASSRPAREENTGPGVQELRAHFQAQVNRNPTPPAPVPVTQESAPGRTVEDPLPSSPEATGPARHQDPVSRAETLVYAGRGLAYTGNELHLPWQPTDPRLTTHRMLLEHSERYRADYERALRDIIGNVRVANADVPRRLQEFAASVGLNPATTRLWAEHHGSVTLWSALSGLSRSEIQDLYSRASAYLNERTDSLRLTPLSPAERLLRDDRLVRVARALHEGGPDAANTVANEIMRERNQRPRARGAGGASSTGSRLDDLESAPVQRGETSSASARRLTEAPGITTGADPDAVVRHVLDGLRGDPSNPTRDGDAARARLLRQLTEQLPDATTRQVRATELRREAERIAESADPRLRSMTASERDAVIWQIAETLHARGEAAALRTVAQLRAAEALLADGVRVQGEVLTRAYGIVAELYPTWFAHSARRQHLELAQLAHVLGTRGPEAAQRLAARLRIDAAGPTARDLQLDSARSTELALRSRLDERAFDALLTDAIAVLEDFARTDVTIDDPRPLHERSPLYYQALVTVADVLDRSRDEPDPMAAAREAAREAARTLGLEPSAAGRGGVDQEESDRTGESSTRVQEQARPDMTRAPVINRDRAVAQAMQMMAYHWDWNRLLADGAEAMEEIDGALVDDETAALPLPASAGALTLAHKAALFDTAERELSPRLPGWAQLPEERKTALKAVLVREGWLRGSGAAIAMGARMVMEVRLLSLRPPNEDSATFLTRALQGGMELIETHHPGWIRQRDVAYRHRTLLSLSVGRLTDPLPHVQAAARAMESTKYGSAPLGAFHLETVRPTRAPDVTILFSRRGKAREDDLAAWAKHKADASAVFHYVRPQGKWLVPIGRAPLPWRERTALYLALHAGPDAFKPFVTDLDVVPWSDNEHEEGSMGVVTSPEHIAEALLAHPTFPEMVTKARQHPNKELHLVLFGCNVGAVLGETRNSLGAVAAWIGARAQVPGLKMFLWGSPHKVSVALSGEVCAEAPLGSTMWVPVEIVPPGYPHVRYEAPFTGATSFQLMTDSPPLRPVRASQELLAKVEEMRLRLTEMFGPEVAKSAGLHYVDVPRHGSKVRGFWPGEGYGVWDMATLQRKMTEGVNERHRVDPGAAIVLGTDFAAMGGILDEEDPTVRPPLMDPVTGRLLAPPVENIPGRTMEVDTDEELPLYGIAPGQLLADLRGWPVIAPAGFVVPGGEKGTGGVLRVEGLPLDTEDIEWSEWVVFWPTQWSDETPRPPAVLTEETARPPVPSEEGDGHRSSGPPVEEPSEPSGSVTPQGRATAAGDAKLAELFVHGTVENPGERLEQIAELAGMPEAGAEEVHTLLVRHSEEYRGHLDAGLAILGMADGDRGEARERLRRLVAERGLDPSLADVWAAWFARHERLVAAYPSAVPEQDGTSLSLTVLQEIEALSAAEEEATGNGKAVDRAHEMIAEFWATLVRKGELAREELEWSASPHAHRQMADHLSAHAEQLAADYLSTYDPEDWPLLGARQRGDLLALIRHTLDEVLRAPRERAQKHIMAGRTLALETDWVTGDAEARPLTGEKAAALMSQAVNYLLLARPEPFTPEDLGTWEVSVLDILHKQLPRWSSLSVREGRALLALIIAEGRQRGMDAAERLVTRLIHEDALWAAGTGGLAFANTVRGANALLRGRLEQRKGRHDPVEWHQQLMAVAHTLAVKGPVEASQLVATSFRARGSATRGMFHIAYVEPRGGKSLVISLHDSDQLSANTPPWQRHDADEGAVYSFVTVDSQARILSYHLRPDATLVTEPLPWAGRHTVYFDLHGGPGFLAPSLAPGAGPWAPMPPAHLAELMSHDQRLLGMARKALAADGVLHLVLASCHAASDEETRYTALDAFAQAMSGVLHRHPGLTLHVHGATSQFHLVFPFGHIAVSSPPGQVWKTVTVTPPQRQRLMVSGKHLHGAMSLYLTTDGPFESPLLEGDALIRALERLPETLRRQVLFVNTLRDGQRFVGYGTEGYRLWDAAELGQEIAEAGARSGIEDGAVIVLGTDYSGVGTAVSGPDRSVMDLSQAPARKLANVRGAPVLAPWGKPVQMPERTGGAPVLTVPRPPEETNNPLWQPWVLHLPDGFDTSVLVDHGRLVKDESLAVHDESDEEEDGQRVSGTTATPPSSGPPGFMTNSYDPAAPMDVTPSEPAPSPLRLPTDRDTALDWMMNRLADFPAHVAVRGEEARRALEADVGTPGRDATPLRMTREQRDDLRLEVARLATRYFPDWHEQSAATQRELVSMVSYEVWAHGHIRGLQLGARLATAYALARPGNVTRARDTLKRVLGIIEHSYPSWFLLHEAGEQWDRVLELVDSLNDGEEAAVRLAVSREVPRQSQGIGFFRATRSSTRSHLANVLILHTQEFLATDHADWADHDPGPQATFNVRHIGQDGSVRLTSGGKLPWGGQLTYYVDAHGDAETLTPALTNAAYGDAHGLVDVSPQHLAQLLASTQEMEALLRYAESTGVMVNLVMIACEFAGVTNHATQAARELAEAIHHPHLTVWANPSMVNMDGGTIQVEIEGEGGDWTWRPFMAHKEQRAEPWFDETAFTAAVSMRSLKDQPIYPLTPSRTLRRLLRQFGERPVVAIDAAPSGSSRIEVYEEMPRGTWKYTARDAAWLGLQMSTNPAVTQTIVVLFSGSTGAGPVIGWRGGEVPSVGQPLGKGVGHIAPPTSAPAAHQEGTEAPAAGPKTVNPVPGHVPVRSEDSFAQILSDITGATVVAPAGPLTWDVGRGPVPTPFLTVDRPPEELDNPAWQEWTVHTPRTLPLLGTGTLAALHAARPGTLPPRLTAHPSLILPLEYISRVLSGIQEEERRQALLSHMGALLPWETGHRTSVAVPDPDVPDEARFEAEQRLMYALVLDEGVVRPIVDDLAASLAVLLNGDGGDGDGGDGGPPQGGGPDGGGPGPTGPEADPLPPEGRTDRPEDTAVLGRADEARRAEALLRGGGPGGPRSLESVAGKLWPGDPYAGADRVHARLIEHSERYRGDYEEARRHLFGDDGAGRPEPGESRLRAHVRAIGLDDSTADHWRDRLRAGRAAETSRDKQRQDAADPLWIEASGLVNQYAPLPMDTGRWTALKRSEMRLLAEEHRHLVVLQLRAGLHEAAVASARDLGRSLGLAPRPYAQGGRRAEVPPTGEPYASGSGTSTTARSSLGTDPSHESEGAADLRRAHELVERLEREASARRGGLDRGGEERDATLDRDDPTPLRPLTDGEATRWVQDQVEQALAQASPGSTRGDLPGDTTATALSELRVRARAAAWEWLSRIERAALSVTPYDESRDDTNTVTSTGESVRAAADLAAQRPWLDPTAEAPPPRGEEDFIAFRDGSRLPAHLRNLGHSTLSIRGVELAAAEIGERLGLPTEAMVRLRQALRDFPHRFLGDGFPLTYRGADGLSHEVVISVRNYGAWSRYRDAAHTPTRLDLEIQRRTGVGEGKALGHAASLTVNVPLGPSTALISPYGSVRAAFRVNEPTYGFTTSGVSQTTSSLRGKDGVHSHIDDLWFEFRDVTERRRPKQGFGLGLRTGSRPPDRLDWLVGGTGRFRTAPVTDGFAVRSALLWVVPDSTTDPPAPDLIPRRIPLAASSVPEIFVAEDFGSVEEIFTWAAALVPGAALASPAHAELRRFFSSENFRGILDQAFRSPVSSQALYKEDGGTLLGAFEVLIAPDTREGATAELVRAAHKTEIRSQKTAKTMSERSRGLVKGIGLGITLGPAIGPRSARFQVSLTGTANFAREHRTTHGSTAASNATATVVDHGGTYTMPLKISARLAGGPWQTFHNSARMRLTRNEARRLAGWDDNAGLPPGAKEPSAPPFLTVDRPVTFGGLTKVKSLDWPTGATGGVTASTTVVEELFDRVHRELADRHPGLVLPPGLHTRTEWGAAKLFDPTAWARLRREGWRGTRQDYATALSNTHKLRDVISQAHTETGLERMMTVGLPVRIHRLGVREEHVTVLIRAELTGRRFVGTRHDVGLRTGTGVTQTARQASTVSQGGGMALNAGLITRLRTGGTAANADTSLGASGTVRHQVSYGPAIAAEGVSAFTGRSHVFAYDISLTATELVFSRPRMATRVATGNVLAAEWFVRRKPASALLGPTLRAEAVKATVELYVPAALTVDEGRHRVKAAEPFPEGLPRELTAKLPLLPWETARRLASGRPMPAFSPQAWQSRPHMVAAAPFPGRLLGAVKQVLGEASGNRWFYATAGTPAHDSLMEGMAPSQIDANFSLAASPFGWQLGGLFGMGAATDQHSSVVIRSRVTSLRPLLYVDDNHGLEISYDAQFHAGWQKGGSTGVSWSFAAGGGRTVNASEDEVVNAEAGDGHVRFIVKSGLSGQVFDRHDSSAVTVQRSATRSTVLGHSGRTVLLIGSVDWTVAAASRGTGFLASSAKSSERWAATVVTNDSGVLIWMAEQDALALGLIDDHLGQLPGWNEQVWREPGWSEGVPPFSFDAGTFDMSALLDAFTTRADASRRDRMLVLPESLLDDPMGQLVRLSVLLSPDGLRAMAHEMLRDGYTLRTFQPRTGVSREGTLSFELRRGTPVLRETRAGHTITTYWSATVSRTGTRRSRQGWSIGPALSGSATRSGITVNAGGADRVGTTTARSVTENHSSTRTSGNEYDGPVAVYTTPYHMTIRVGSQGKERFRVEAPIGELREYQPLSLLEPVPGPVPPGGEQRSDPPAHLTAAPGPGLLPPERGSTDVLHAWLQDRGNRLFRQGPRTVTVQGVGGSKALLDAALLAVGAAMGTAEPTKTSAPASAETAEQSGTPNGTTVSIGGVPRPVRPGTPAHAVLSNALGAGSLQAFFHEAVEHGLAVTLHDTALFGNMDLELRLAPRVEFDGAALLAVDHGNDLSHSVKIAESTARSDSSVDSRHPTVTGGPAFITGDPLFSRVGSSAAAPTGTTADAITQDPTSVVVDSSKLKLPVGRSLLFRLPVTWLVVADAKRRGADAVAKAASVLGVEATSKPSGVARLPLDNGVLVWVREDFALERGLVTEENFPDEVSAAWDRVRDATQQWQAATSAYQAARAAASGASREWDEALEEAAEDERAWQRAVAAARQAERVRERAEQAGAGHEPARPRVTGADPDAGLGAAEAPTDQAHEDELAALEAYRRSSERLRGRGERLVRLHQELSDQDRAVREAGARMHGARTAADAVTAWYQRPADERTDSRPGPWDPEAAVALPDEPEVSPVPSVEELLYSEAGAAEDKDEDTEIPLAQDVFDTWLADEAGGLGGLRTGAKLLPAAGRAPGLAEAQEETILHAWRRVHAYGLAWVTADAAYHAARAELARHPADPEAVRRLGVARAAAVHALRTSEAVRDRALAITRWHTTAPERRPLTAPAPWLPPARPNPPAPDALPVSRFDRETHEGTGAPLSLTAPDGRRLRIVDPVSHPSATGDAGPDSLTEQGTSTAPHAGGGESFHRALSLELDRVRPDWRDTHGIGGARPGETAAALRELLARTLEAADLLDPANPDSPSVDDVTAIEPQEKVTGEELDRAGIVLAGPHREEFEALALLPTGATHALASRPELRRALLAALLRRRGDAADDTGWRHTAADLMAPLAAQALGIRITVVRDDLGHQTYGDPTRPEIVLHLAAGHWYAAQPDPSS